MSLPPRDPKGQSKDLHDELTQVTKKLFYVKLHDTKFCL